MRAFFLLLLFFVQFSCINKDSTCKIRYVGVFTYDSSVNIDKEYKNIIFERGWDTIHLISDSTGKYYFTGSDLELKKCEGNWYTKSNNIEGQCIGFTKQNNLQKPHTSEAFTIYSGRDDKLQFMIPFKLDTLLSVVFSKSRK